jgi:hypothetical protein
MTIGHAKQTWHHFPRESWSAISVSSGSEAAKRAVGDVALLQDMAAARPNRG